MPRNSPLRAAIPRLPRLPGGSTLSRPQGYAGAVRIPRSTGVTQESLRAYPPKPAGFRGPETEWAVYWVLTSVLKMKPYPYGTDFYYQEAVTFAYFARGFQRVDFLCMGPPRGRAMPPSGYKACAIDPISSYTHKNASLDRLKKAALAAQGIWLVWIDMSALQWNPVQVVRNALRGIDTSSRGLGR